MRLVLALIAGSLFGAGLFVSGMTDTTKVQGWLDVFGDWDPTLAFVMGGAVIPMFFAWRLTKGRRPVAGGEFPHFFAGAAVQGIQFAVAAPGIKGAVRAFQGRRANHAA